MTVSVEDADECQMCEEREATQAVQLNIGGIALGPLFVCDSCAEDDER